MGKILLSPALKTLEHESLIYLFYFIGNFDDFDFD